jgi:hypothetical protein
VAEAVEARYQVGIMLWNTSVVDLAEPTSDGNSAMKLLRRTDKAAGGNNLIGPLEHCHDILDRFKDAPDRVVALFGDGDLTPKARVLSKVAQMKEENIRFVTRGLGERAAAEFGEISSEEPSSATIDDVEKLAEGIGQMGASLKKKRKQGLADVPQRRPPYQPGRPGRACRLGGGLLGGRRHGGVPQRQQRGGGRADRRGRADERAQRHRALAVAGDSVRERDLVGQHRPGHGIADPRRPAER